MTRFSEKVTASIPAAHRDRVNLLLKHQGAAGPDTFWIPLENAQGRVIRYGTKYRLTSAQRRFLKAVLDRPQNEGDLSDTESVEEHARRLGLKRRRGERKARKKATR